jgi:hypothetical protein
MYLIVNKLLSLSPPPPQGISPFHANAKQKFSKVGMKNSNSTKFLFHHKKKTLEGNSEPL